MRARLAIASAGVTCDLREVVLRDKPPEFLNTSPSATVPCLKTGTLVIDESLDIMIWALEAHDPERWLDMPPSGRELIAQADGPFKSALDHYKYASRHADLDPLAERETAAGFLRRLDATLHGKGWLFGSRPALADMAIAPFVRQFAHVDLDWFGAQPWPDLIAWVTAFKASDRFAAIMARYPKWQDGDKATRFPA